MEKVLIGQTHETEQGRDAVHVAVAPAIAGEKLWAGYEVGFTAEDGRTVGTGSAVKLGIVDPFIRGAIRKGQKFYVWLYPNTVTSLRHVWSHPQFVARPRVEVAHAG